MHGVAVQCIVSVVYGVGACVMYVPNALLCCASVVLCHHWVPCMRKS